MGSGNSKLSKTEERLVDQNQYRLNRDIPIDQRYGENVRVYEETTSPNYVAIIEKVFDSEIPFLAVYDVQKQMQLLQHPGLLQLLNVETKTKSSFCSKHFKLKMLYEYVDRDLRENIAQRIVCQEDLNALNNQEVSAFFEEGELWYILATVVSVLAYLHDQGVVHGDIRPSSIFLTKQGNLKLVGVNSFIKCGWSSYLEKMEGMETKSTYLSPIQVSALQHKILQPVHNVPKSDLYVLGVILLECATLKSVQEIYNFETYTIDSSRIVEQLHASKRYSDLFIEILIDLLQIDETIRLDPEQIYEKITNLATEEYIAISPKIDSLEKAQSIVAKNKPQMEVKLSVKTPENPIVLPEGFQIPEDFQNALVLIPSSKAAQLNNSPESGQQLLSQDQLQQQQQQVQNQQLETEDEQPNQEEGQILEDNQSQQQHNDSFRSTFLQQKNPEILGQENTKHDISGISEIKPQARRQLSEGKEIPNSWNALKNVIHNNNEQIQAQQQKQQLTNNEINNNNALQGLPFHNRSQSQHSQNTLQPQLSGGLGGLGKSNQIGRVALMFLRMQEIQKQKQKQLEFVQQQQEILQQQQLQEYLLQQEMGNQNHNFLPQNQQQQMYMNNNNNFFAQNQMGNQQAQLNQAINLQNLLGNFGGQNYNMNNNGMFDQMNNYNSPQKNAMIAQLQQQLQFNQLAGNQQSSGGFNNQNIQGLNAFQQAQQLQGLLGNNNNILNNNNGFNGLSLGHDSNQFNPLNNNNFASPTFNTNNNSVQGMSGMSGHFGGGNSISSTGSSNALANKLFQAMNSGGKSANFLSNTFQHNSNNNSISGNGIFQANNNINNGMAAPNQQDGILNKLAGVFGNNNNNNNNNNNLNNNPNSLGQNVQTRAPIF